jgi:hypothetical protein
LSHEHPIYGKQDQLHSPAQRRATIDVCRRHYRHYERRPALDLTVRSELLAAVRRFDAFTADNDPHGEHDFGAVAIGDQSFFFKIDYYDRSLTLHSPNAADPAVTTRVLTVMRADEY